MYDETISREKREFLRYDYDKPINFSTISPSQSYDIMPRIAGAVPRNLSAAGIFFITNLLKVPKISDLILLDIDLRTAAICKEIEHQALLFNNKLVGRVVRIEDNENGTCGVGVAFVKKSEPVPSTLGRKSVSV